MGLWRYVDQGVCHEDEEALARALSAQGERNLFHDDQLLLLEHQDTRLERPPLTVRRFTLTLARSDWLDGTSSSGTEEQRRWTSDPVPLAADDRPPAADLPALHALFSQVHEYLHSASPAARPAAARSVPPPTQTTPPTHATPPSRRKRSIVVALLLVAGALLAMAVSQGLSRTSERSGSSAWSAGASRPSAADVAALTSKVSPGLVDITASLPYQNAQMAGTGIVLSAWGEILTNNHVIDGATAVSVTDLGNGQAYQAYVIGYDRSLDIAVLQLTAASGLQTIRSGDSSKLKIGQGVVAIGNAGGVGGTPKAAAGTVVALDQQVVATNQENGSAEQLAGLIGVDADVQPGDSGGPLVDAAGRTTGIDTAAAADFSFLSGASRGFAIPISQALAIAQKIESGRPSAGVHIGSTAFLGVELSTAQSAGQSDGGATVAGVLPGTPAQQLGLSSGDVITSLAGQTVDSAITLTSILDGCQPGARVTLGWVDLSGQQHTASVQLGSGPPA